MNYVAHKYADVDNARKEFRTAAEAARNRSVRTDSQIFATEGQDEDNESYRMVVEEPLGETRNKGSGADSSAGAERFLVHAQQRRTYSKQCYHKGEFVRTCRTGLPCSNQGKRWESRKLPSRKRSPNRIR